MKPIYVLVRKDTGGFDGCGSRKIRAYTTTGRAKVQQGSLDEIVTYVPQVSGTITVGSDHYEYLLDRLNFLDALESAGVDNWGGYGDAYEIYEDKELYEGEEE